MCSSDLPRFDIDYEFPFSKPPTGGTTVSGGDAVFVFGDARAFS
jgi:hypothetical protein